MDLILIGRLMEMLENSSLDTLDVSEGGMRIRLSKTAGDGSAAPNETAEPGESPEYAAEAEIAEMMALGRVSPTSQTQPIRAGLPGTFYRAPSPGAEPYAQEGWMVEEGQTLGLIEAMKMLNPVEAPHTGRITGFLVEDGTPVTAGTALILVDPAE